MFTKRLTQLQELAELPDQINATLADFPVQGTAWHPDAQTWSILMSVAHLYHSEAFMQQRFRRIITEHNPTLPGFGPDDATPQTTLEFDELLKAFHAVRMETLAILYELTPEDWSRPAVHAVQGETTLQLQVQNMIDHDREHLEQIHAVIQQYSMEHS